MTVDHLRRQAQGHAQFADFVLNSSRSGSSSFRFSVSGRPPTLWCDLIEVALPVLAPADSMTSG